MGPEVALKVLKVAKEAAKIETNSRINPMRGRIGTIIQAADI